LKALSPILTGHLESIVWIRPEGRGTFLESPFIGNFVEAAVEAGHSDFVIDLEACSGMDSTFMGMMAGLGISFRRKKKGQLTIVGTNDKTKASLLELGLHHLSRIEPSEGAWVGRYDEFRSGLIPLTSEEIGDKESHILKCHENLCEAEASNVDRFKTVLEMLGSQMVEGSSDGEETKA